jgi:hypothetical protein
MYFGSKWVVNRFWSQKTLSSDFSATMVVRIWVKPNNVLSAFFFSILDAKKQKKIKIQSSRSTKASSRVSPHKWASAGWPGLASPAVFDLFFSFLFSIF